MRGFEGAEPPCCQPGGFEPWPGFQLWNLLLPPMTVLVTCLETSSYSWRSEAHFNITWLNFSIQYGAPFLRSMVFADLTTLKIYARKVLTCTYPIRDRKLLGKFDVSIRLLYNVYIVSRGGSNWHIVYFSPIRSQIFRFHRNCIVYLMALHGILPYTLIQV